MQKQKISLYDAYIASKDHVLSSPKGSKHYALTGGLPFDGEHFRPNHVVVICEGIFEALMPEVELNQEIECIDVHGAIIAPGFIDLQLNGCGGVMFDDSLIPQTLEIMCATNLKSGCTSFLPTLTTTSEETMLKALDTVIKFREELVNNSVLGLHLEGPFISKERKGIHNETFIRALSPSIREKLTDFAAHTPLMLTLAPECVSAEDIRLLTDAGVVVSIGHSAATYEETLIAIEAGAKSATHLFNAMSPWKSRAPGVVGAVLESANITCGLIADGHHSHLASLRLAKRLKSDKCFFVTDATAPVGTDMKEFDFTGQTVYVRNGKAVNADGTLGGSLLTMIESVKNGVTRLHWSIEECLRMASLYPARLMRKDDCLGKIATGYKADLALFSPIDYSMIAVVDKGRLHVYPTDY